MVAACVFLCIVLGFMVCLQWKYFPDCCTVKVDGGGGGDVVAIKANTA
jgi:hypothetical protein